MGPAGCTMNLRRTHVLHKTPMLPPGKCPRSLGPIPGSLAGRVIMLQYRLWLKALRVTLLPPGSMVVLRELTTQTAVFTGTLKSWCPSRPPTPVSRNRSCSSRPQMAPRPNSKSVLATLCQI